MEVSYFIRVLKRNKFLILLVSIISVIVTFFLVHNQPDQYTSQARIATGFVDQSQKLEIGGVTADPQESKIAQDFSNLLEMLKSKKNLDQLAYKLIIHDLTQEPYRTPSKLMQSLNAESKQHAIQVFTDHYNKRESLSLFDKDQKGLSDLIASMNYNDAAILKNLTIYRVQSSDYVDVTFDSENAYLSAVVVNAVCNEFITYYAKSMHDNQTKALDFWSDLLKAKSDTMNKRIDDLKDFKIKNNVLNLNEKARSVYGQISDFETRREDAERTSQSTQAAINNIDKQFDPTDRRYFESAKVDVTQQYLSAKAQLDQLSNEQVQSNFNPKYNRQVDSLKNVISSKLQQLSDKYVLNPLTAKQALVDQKQQLQIQHDLAKNSEAAINKELARLNVEFKNYVPNDGIVQALENAVTVSTQEYMDVLSKYNQANVSSKLSTQLRLIQPGEPGALQPSKKMLLVILSGVISFVFCILVLFLFVFFDTAIKTPVQLANATGMPVLGYVNLLSSKKIDLKEFWNSGSGVRSRQLRNLIQSLRFEIDNELGEDKILLINSMESDEGKTFIATNLAYAYSSLNKKVLLMDGNFHSPGITNFSQTRFYIEDFLVDNIDPAFLAANSKIKILGNKGEDVSILEVIDKVTLQKQFDLLKDNFDMIIIEAASLDNLNKSKEWTLVADKVLTVFEAGKKIKDSQKQNIKYLKNLKGKFIGYALNLVRTDKMAEEDE